MWLALSDDTNITTISSTIIMSKLMKPERLSPHPNSSSSPKEWRHWKLRHLKITLNLFHGQEKAMKRLTSCKFSLTA